MPHLKYLRFKLLVRFFTRTEKVLTVQVLLPYPLAGPAPVTQFLYVTTFEVLNPLS